MNDSQLARVDRTLDIARELLLTCGYKRTTVEEIARRADIGKGTVYLHWRTKDDLVHTLLRQEVTLALRELAASVLVDPRAAQLHRITHRLFVVLAKYPLFRALLARDKEILGRTLCARHGGSDKYRITAVVPLHGCLEVLAEHGCLREDLDVDMIDDRLNALVAGFFVLEEESSSQWRGDPVKGRAHALATMVRSSLERTEPPPESTLRALAEQLSRRLDPAAGALSN